MKNYIGFDIGGTFVKGGIINELGKLLSFDEIPTKNDTIISDLASFASRLIVKSGLNRDDIEGIGMGIPGMIDSESGTVVFAGNLGWRNFEIAKELSSSTGFPVNITNDANAAALGEAKFGAGKNYHDSILVTLGTGVGGGIVINGKIFDGNKSQGAEIGHMVIVHNGEPCTCGRNGCLEVYTSATALTRMTREAMVRNRSSAMWKTYTIETASGKTAFDYWNVDASAKEVVETYISYLACGLANIANIFRPEVIMIGGGVSRQGEVLTKPLQALFDKELFGNGLGTYIPIIPASLGNKAGTLGAAAYSIERLTK